MEVLVSTVHVRDREIASGMQMDRACAACSCVFEYIYKCHTEEKSFFPAVKSRTVGANPVFQITSW